MDKKTLVKRYIDTIITINGTAERLNEIFGEINPDNSIFSIVPEHVIQFLSDLVYEHLTDQEIGWMDWWLYDCQNFDTKIRKGFVSDKTGAGDLENFEEFYAFAFENKPMNEILDNGLH